MTLEIKALAEIGEYVILSRVKDSLHIMKCQLDTRQVRENWEVWFRESAQRYNMDLVENLGLKSSECENEYSKLVKQYSEITGKKEISKISPKEILGVKL